MARAILIGSLASAMAVLLITASQPISIDTTASEAVPTPASTSTGIMASGTSAQPASPCSSEADSTTSAREAKAAEIATQPITDVGLHKVEIPVPLQAAQKEPYRVADAKTCAQVITQLKDLDDALGPDIDRSNDAAEDRAGALAAAGGATLVNSIIPFRGMVREVSGAAPAKRRLHDAVDASFARRGFLRGLYIS